MKRIIIDNSQGALPYIHDHIKTQRMMNRRYSLGIIMLGMSLIALSKVIDDLNKEVQELKQARGE